ncbi:hypothetical protein KFL_003710130 [Klebsormidium nitens]|uniref:Uncharacterized protein n=1 Tax=Klebsormidium nitens TaxID=105231 RepID=A0A1Y1IG53_KLENI|nr:hypothetical protein KFL_003710130 [Klebsormidium nitens]|eukprot:GAQ87707.1 hypothetical protein KFL_003710130 [Klebsormidium nitens]
MGGNTMAPGPGQGDSAHWYLLGFSLKPLQKMMRDMSAQVPRIIHQAFFAPKVHNLQQLEPWLERANAMQEYAAQWGYTYIRWDLSSSNELERLLGSEGFQLLQLEISKEHLASAANLVRYVVLEEHGGFWIDLDYSLPKDHTTGELIDLLDVFSPSGATFVPEASCRNIEKSAIFVETSLFSCPPHHPIIRRMIASQIQNFEVTNGVDLAKRGGSFVQTGTMLFNKVLFGKYTLIDRQTLDTIMSR